MTNIDPTLTEIKDKETRASAEYWVDRVNKVGNHKSPFMDKPQEEIDFFTARHRKWVEPWVAGKGVLEIGCGYGRNMEMFRSAKWYNGLECSDALIEEARRNYNMYFGGIGVFFGDLRTDDFKGFDFDICVAIAVISSTEPYFHDLKKRLLEAMNPGGVILWAEESYIRVDYK